MPGEDKEGFWSGIIKAVLIAGLSALATGYATNMVNKKEVVDVVQQNKEGSNKSQGKINELVKKNDELIEQNNELAEKYNILLEKYKTKISSRTKAADPFPEDNFPVEEPVFTPKTQGVNVNGQWLTPDGTIIWSFNGNSVSVFGVGAYVNYINGMGNFSQNQYAISGRINLTVFFGVPTNAAISFNASLNTEGGIITGQIVDMYGTVTPLTLYRQS